MKDYLEDRKIDKKLIIINRIFLVIFFLVFIVTSFFAVVALEDKVYIITIISVLFLILVIGIIIMIDEKTRKKYNTILKKRIPYYTFDLNQEYSYNDLVLLLDKLRKRKDKWYIKKENEMIFRLKYGFVHEYIYRINIIKYDDFIETGYQNKLVKLNKEYTDKFGTDEENYTYHNHKGGGESLHRINFIHSNELNKELKKVISKDAKNYLFTGKTSQTAVIVGNKMYVPTVRTASCAGFLKHNRTLNYIIKWFNIEA